MAGPKRGGGGEGEGSIDAYLFVIAAFICILCLLIWFKMRAVIVIPAFAIDYAFVWLVEHTVGIGPTGQQYKEYITGFLNGTYDAWTDIPWSNFVQVRSTVGSQVRLVVSILISAMGVYLLFKMKGSGFKRRFGLAHNLQKKDNKTPSLATYQSQQWKVATYSAMFDPDGRDKDIRPQLRPTEWLHENDISWENSRFDAQSKARLYEVLKAQLGEPWHGFERANIHVQTILILGSLHYLGSMERFHKIYKDLAIREREMLNIAWAGDSNGMEASKSLIERYKGKPEVMKVIEHHCKKFGFENTAVYGFMSITKKKSGIFKDSDMGYIKRLDRTLWYTLNNNGRHAYHVEATAVINHWKAELSNQAPLREARVEESVLGIERYLNDQGIVSLTEFFKMEKNSIEPDFLLDV